jgi:hypothetical protein
MRTIYTAGLALLCVAAASLVFAGAALAIDDDPKEPPPPVPVANLQFSAGTVQPFGLSQWEIRYTVVNRGTAATPFFRVAVQENGGGTIKDTFHSVLAPGASRSEVIHVNRTGCYFAVRFVADSTRVVRESNELDNTRVASVVTDPLCSQLPRYKVKAVSFRAVDETGVDIAGSDEPYWIFSSVGQAGTARTTASHVFGSIDTGDTASFGVTEGCIYVSCAGGAAPFGIGFSIQLWEQDNNDLAKVLKEVSEQFPKAGALSSLVSAPTWVGTAVPIVGGILGVIAGLAEDDLVGSQTYAYSRAFLEAKAPAVGSSFTEIRRYGSDSVFSGLYDLTTTVTRVA